MTQNQIINLVKTGVAALTIVPLFTTWTPAQTAGWNAMLLTVNGIFGQMQSNLDPITKNLPPSAKD